MNSQKRKQLVLRLIANDLINHKLVMGLEQLGIDASEYHLYLNTSIFKLMGFAKQDRTDALYKQYHEHCHKVLIIDLSGNRADLEALGVEIYERLLEFRV
jgi:hypothetical protein